MIYKLGKKPVRHDKRTLKLSNYLKLSALPPIPDQFGHDLAVSDWGMLGNDSVGDCVLAGAAHETMLWHFANNNPVGFSDASVLSDYSAITGYNPADPNTDQGTDPLAAMKYRVNTGILDATGKRHTLGAFVALEPGNLAHLFAAMYLFGAVGIGIEFPDYAMDQFNSGLPWDYLASGSNEGGHYIPLVAKRNNLIVVTWGREQEMTLPFYQKQCDEAYGLLSDDYLNNGVSPEGFNLDQLREDLQAIKA